MPVHVMDCHMNGSSRSVWFRFSDPAVVRGFNKIIYTSAETIETNQSELN